MATQQQQRPPPPQPISTDPAHHQDDDEEELGAGPHHHYHRAVGGGGQYCNNDSNNDDSGDGDILVPHFDSERRHAAMLPAAFNLVATIVGGGVLSLPLAFAKCGGVMNATAFMLIAAIATDRSLHLLCRAARCSGAATYGEVARRAWGHHFAEWAVAALLAVFLLFVVTAYMVLLRDIWTPLLMRFLWRLSLQHHDDNNNGADDNVEHDNNQTTTTTATTTATDDENWVLLFLVVAVTPFLVQRDLYALRYNCYIGFGSISVLCAALCHRAWWTATTTTIVEGEDTAVSSSGVEPATIESTSTTTSTATTFSDWLFAFPIITLSFLSQFNILPIQNSLVRPTRRRMRRVVRGAVLASGVLMYLLGAAGYACFGSATRGNILLNLSSDRSWPVAVGRLGCGITILLALPLMVLPCRRNILELLDCWVEEWRATGNSTTSSGQQEHQEQQQAYHAATAATTTITATETTALMAAASSPPPPPIHTVHRSHSLEERVHVADVPAVHYGSTLLIVAACYLAAVAAPGVAVVWSLCGSGMAFAIAFVLPAACFLRIQRKFGAVAAGTTDRKHRPQQRQPRHSVWGWTVLAWVLLVSATVAAIACTCQTTYLLIEPPKR